MPASSRAAASPLESRTKLAPIPVALVNAVVFASHHSSVAPHSTVISPPPLADEEGVPAHPVARTHPPALS